MCLKNRISTEPIESISRTRLRESRTPLSATPSPADSVRVWEYLYNQHDRATHGHLFQPHPPQPIRVVAYGRLAHPSHALAGTLSRPARRAPLRCMACVKRSGGPLIGATESAGGRLVDRVDTHAGPAGRQGARHNVSHCRARYRIYAGVLASP